MIEIAEPKVPRFFLVINSELHPFKNRGSFSVGIPGCLVSARYCYLIGGDAMKVELIVVNMEPEKSLKEAKMCQVFRFLDVSPDEFVPAVAISGETFHFVHEGDKKVAGSKWVVSLDGQMVKCCPSWRPVAFLDCELVLGDMASARALLSNANPGQVVALMVAKSKDGVFMVAKGNPTPPGKVILISVHDGKYVVVDDNINVHLYPDAHFEKKIKF